MDFLREPAFWVIIAALSEVIGMTPKLKENSILQLAIKAVMALKPKKD
nr:hypothetical protein [uncultured Mediterranean phage uvMED]